MISILPNTQCNYRRVQPQSYIMHRPRDKFQLLARRLCNVSQADLKALKP